MKPNPPVSKSQTPIQATSPGWNTAAEPVLNPGVEFAGFQIERHLHRGAVGDCYLAREGRGGPRVVLKILPREFLNEVGDMNEVGARFQRSVHALMLTNTPQLPGIRGYQIADGHQFLVYEHIEGTPLTGREKLDLKQVLGLIRDCATGLGALHAVGFMHRELRPQTIFRTPQGRVVFAEVGIFRLTMDEESSRRIPLSEFSSPEQFAGERTIDIRSDLHSLGVLMHLLLTGSMPFTAKTSDRFKAQVLDGARPSLREYDPEIHPAVERIVSRCLARQADDRYQSPEALIRDLEACPLTKPLKAQQKFWREAQAWARAHWLIPVRMVVAIVLVYAGFAAWSWYGRHEMASQLTALDDPACSAAIAEELAPVLTRYRNSVGLGAAEGQRWAAALEGIQAREAGKKAPAPAAGK